MKIVVGVVLAGAVMSTGCRSIPIPYGSRDTSVLEGGVLNPPETGVEYCRRLAVVADKKGQMFLGLGIAMGIVAAGAAVAGAAMGPDTAPDANWAEKNRNALVVASGGVLAIPTTILLMRSKDASSASSAASGGISKEDSVAMDACLKARSDWANARGAAADVAQKKLNDRIDELTKARDKTEDEVKKDEETAATATDPTTRAAALRDANIGKQRMRAIDDEILRMLAPTNGGITPPMPTPPASMNPGSPP